jgi:hypothetical protein
MSEAADTHALLRPSKGCTGERSRALLVEVMEDRAVAGVGAVWASDGVRTVIVIDPDLSAKERQTLIKELTGG